MSAAFSAGIALVLVNAGDASSASEIRNRALPFGEEITRVVVDLIGA